MRSENGPSLSKIYLHIVFSTKDRTPHFDDPSARVEMHAYLRGICEHLKAPARAVGGTADHVHLAVLLPRTLAVMNLVRRVKRSSSSWVKKRFLDKQSFYWQKGYGAFSVSPDHLPGLVHYIENQEEHHRDSDFQQEFRGLLEEHGIEYDEQYVWE